MLPRCFRGGYNGAIMVLFYVFMMVSWWFHGTFMGSGCFHGSFMVEYAPSSCFMDLLMEVHMRFRGDFMVL